MKEDAPDHPKMKRLRRLLKIPLPFANGIMERLWHFTGKYEPDGGIGRKSDDEIAEACAMPDETDTAAFVGALVDAGFLDEVPICRLYVHDWASHCNYFTHNKIARQKAFFADGSKPSLRRLDARYKPEAENFYSVSAQTGHMSAQTGHVSAQTGHVSAQTGHVRDYQKTPVSAQTGHMSAHGKAVRARALPTPTPTPTPTPLSAAALPAEVILPPTEQQQQCTVDSAAVAAALRAYGSITKPSVRRFITACLNGTGYSEVQIVQAIEQVGGTISKRADNPIGILIAQVPAALPGLVTGEGIQARRPHPGSNEERTWLMAEQAMQNPEATKEAIEWAKNILGKN